MVFCIFQLFINVLGELLKMLGRPGKVHADPARHGTTAYI